MLVAFIHGFVLAFGLIIPLGIQNMFVFSQGAVHQRWARALPAVFTAAICDTLLITIAVMGVSVVVLQITWFRYLLTVGGLFFLVYMGWLTWHAAPQAERVEVSEQWPSRRQIVFAASVSLLNPHAILDTIGVIGTSSLHYGQWPERLCFAAACILVSWIWFSVLMALGHVAKKWPHMRFLQQNINRISALIMWGCGLYLAASLL